MVTVRFQLEDEQPQESFALVYRAEECSISPDPFPGGGEASLLINDVNLELDNRSRVLYAWGYCPLVRATATTEKPKRGRVAMLSANLEEALVPGSSLRLNTADRWPVYLNDEVGWICIGEPRVPAHAIWVEFASATVAALIDAEIRALWMRPVTLPKEVCSRGR